MTTHGKTWGERVNKCKKGQIIAKHDKKNGVIRGNMGET